MNNRLKTRHESLRFWPGFRLALKGIAGLRLYVDKTNHRAIKVYTKPGMNGEHYQLFEWMVDE